MHMTKIQASTGKAIIDAYSMNAWAEDGKYWYEDEEEECYVGIHTTAEEIYIEKFIGQKMCLEWLSGELELSKLKQNEKGLFVKREVKI